MTEAKSRHFWVRTMYGAKTREPLVVLTMPGGESVQMSVEDARALAANILQGAEAALADGYLVEWAGEHDFDERQAAILMNEYRQWRERKGL